MLKRFGILLIGLLLCLQGADARLLRGNSAALASLSQSNRIVLNEQFEPDYACINFLVCGTSWFPYGGGWASGVVLNSAVLDAQGYPCTNQVNAACPYGNGFGVSATNPANGRQLFSTLFIPATPNYPGAYCVVGVGSGNLNLFVQDGSPSGTFVAASSQTCATYSGGACASGMSNAVMSGSTVVATDETWAGWCIPVQFVAANGYGGTSGGGEFIVRIDADDPNSSGHYLKGLQFYEQPEGARLAAGKVFRLPYLQMLATLDPSALREMNLNCGNSCPEMSFLDRAIPSNTLGMFGDTASLKASLPYGQSTGTNQLTIAGVTGTPASMTHGERVWFRAGSSSTGYSASDVTAVTVVGTTVTVTMSGATGYTTGEQIVFYTGSGSSAGISPANILNLYPATIAVVDSTHFTFVFANAGSVVPCASQSACLLQAFPYLSMNVGNRGFWPIINYNGHNPYSLFFNLGAGTYYGFCFDKNLPGSSDGAGNLIFGAWLPCSSTANATGRAVPVEYLVEKINEINELNPAHPVNLWLVASTVGLTCNSFYADPDCNSSNEWTANLTNVVMNGANGFSGLKSPAQLIWQLACNECWNFVWAQTQQLGYRAALRYGIPTHNDWISFSELLSLNQAYDVKISPYYSSRVHFVDAGWVDTGTDEVRITGVGLASLNDAENPIAGGAPITMYDWGFAIAPYLDAGSGTLVGTPTAPGTIICGTSGGCGSTNGWIFDVAAGGYSSTNSQADLSAWVSAINSNGPPAWESIYSTLANITQNGTTNNGGVPYNKPMLGYEGSVCGGGSGTPWCSWTTGAPLSALSCSGGTVSGTAPAGFYPAGTWVAIENVSVAGYNQIVQVATSPGGGAFTFSLPTCPTGTPSTTNWQGFLGNATDVVSALNRQTYFSPQWATAFQAFITNLNTITGVKMLAIYVSLTQTWGSSYFDSFGTGTIEGAGMSSSWIAIGNYNRAQPN